MPRQSQPPGNRLPTTAAPHCFAESVALFVTLHRAIVESLASENASRLAAMHAAERNIDDRLAALRGEFHLHRQTAITGELLEIVSGYEAMTHGSR
jgi:F-type H+-transporting ATPase subunit gamma